MSYRKDFTLPAELLERVGKQGMDILPKEHRGDLLESIQVIIDGTMQCGSSFGGVILLFE
jgi:hypothetical protein